MNAKHMPDGSRFGRLLVVGRAPNRGAKRAFHVKCDCGTELNVLRDSLTSGRSRSCGCLKMELQTTHGRTGDAIYRAWQNMIGRCENESLPNYPNYGGRGIKVCERWKVFVNFLEDMGEPGHGLSIDRIDNSKGYEPGNCRWATPAQQAQNKRSSVITADMVNEARGRAEHGESVASIARRFGVRHNAIWTVVRRRSWRNIAP